MTRLALAALAALLPLSASAQKTPPKSAARTAETAQPVPITDAATLPDTLRPGDLPIVAPMTGEVAYTVRLLAPMQQDIGTLTETTALDGDVVTRTSVVNVPMAGQNETTVSTLDLGTWAFRTVTMEGATAVGALTLADGRVTGTRGTISEPGETLDPQSVEEAVTGDLFGAGWPSMLVRSIPLTAGMVRHVATYSAQDGVVTERLTVLGEQTIKPAGGAARTLVAVETNDGETTMTHFVDPTTRDIVMVRFSPQPGVEVEFVRD